MASLYFCNVSGDGLSPETSFTPAVTTSGRWACLMIHEPKRRAIIVAQDDAIADAGVTKLLTGTSLANLRNKAKTTNPTAGQRTAMGTWLANNGYQPLTASEATWWDCIHFIARQVNPVADLDATG